MTTSPEARPHTAPAALLTHAEAVSRARDLAADVRSRALEAETIRHLPDATFRSFVDAGLVRLLTPRASGGHELPLAAFIDATLEIARADASAGWCFSFANIHSWLLAKFPRQAQAAWVGLGIPSAEVSAHKTQVRLLVEPYIRSMRDLDVSSLSTRRLVLGPRRLVPQH